jgi:murein DD-endopeptidase MepM/ murein hydrolase activator NlpD
MTGLALSLLLVTAHARRADAIELGIPAGCTLGTDCFVQQFADMKPGPGAQDPFCGSATYDGHSGTDLRILSMRDMERGVDVVAMADGTVLRARDGAPDRLVRTEQDEAAVKDRECGNGVLITHARGYETQYCHLKQGSILVRPGDAVVRAQPIGKIGASGLAAFPHVHVTVRKAGVDLDPMTGRLLTDGCAADPAAGKSLFSQSDRERLGTGKPQLLAAGVTDGPVEEDDLETDGPPDPANAASQAIVGWAWLIDLAKGDALTVTLLAPDGSVLSEQPVPPLDRSKATYVAYAGRKRIPVVGDYAVRVMVIRDGKPIIDVTNKVAVR